MGVLLNGSSWASTPAAYNRTSTDHTVSYWLRLDDNTAVRRPFGSTGLWEARTGGGGSNVLTSDYLQSGTLVTATLTPGVYQHVVFVQDVTGGNKLAYIDGVLVGNISSTFAGAQNAILNIGVSAGGATQGWFGAIDDIRIYERVLSQEEIQTIFTCRGTDAIFDGLSHRWPMNEGAEGATSTGLLDEIGGLDCTTITGTPVYNYDAGIIYRRYV